MGLFDIFKKEKKQEKKMEECTGDPSCPMCHLDDKALKTLKKSAKETKAEENVGQN